MRSLTKAGIKFQKSVNIGSRRNASQNDADDAIASVEGVVVVDIRKFPNLSFNPLDTKWLLRQAHKGVLTASGLSAPRFYRMLADEFEIEHRPGSFGSSDGAVCRCIPRVAVGDKISGSLRLNDRAWLTVAARTIGRRPLFSDLRRSHYIASMVEAEQADLRAAIPGAAPENARVLAATGFMCVALHASPANGARVKSLVRELAVQ